MRVPSFFGQSEATSTIETLPSVFIVFSSVCALLRNAPFFDLFDLTCPFCVACSPPLICGRVAVCAVLAFYARYLTDDDLFIIPRTSLSRTRVSHRSLTLSLFCTFLILFCDLQRPSINSLRLFPAPFFPLLFRVLVPAWLVPFVSLASRVCEHVFFVCM